MGPEDQVIGQGAGQAAVGRCLVLGSGAAAGQGRCLSVDTGGAMWGFQAFDASPAACLCLAAGVALGALLAKVRTQATQAHPASPARRLPQCQQRRISGPIAAVLPDALLCVLRRSAAHRRARCQCPLHRAHRASPAACQTPAPALPPSLPLGCTSCTLCTTRRRARAALARRRWPRWRRCTPRTARWPGRASRARARATRWRPARPGSAPTCTASARPTASAWAASSTSASSASTCGPAQRPHAPPGAPPPPSPARQSGFNVRTCATPPHHPRPPLRPRIQPGSPGRARRVHPTWGPLSKREGSPRKGQHGGCACGGAVRADQRPVAHRGGAGAGHAAAGPGGQTARLPAAHLRLLRPGAPLGGGMLCVPALLPAVQPGRKAGSLLRRAPQEHRRVSGAAAAVWCLLRAPSGFAGSTLWTQDQGCLRQAPRTRMHAGHERACGEHRARARRAPATRRSPA